MIAGNPLPIIIYVSGCIVAAWLCGIMIKISLNKGEDIESGTAGCTSCLSWIAVIILIWRYRKTFKEYFGSVA